MTARRPDLGALAPIYPTAEQALEIGRELEATIANARASVSTASGAWRPDDHFNAHDGLKVTLRREPGMTPPDMLLVPFRFQAPPLDRFGRAWTADWPTTQTISGGEQARPGGVQLKRPSFQTLFVDDEHPWLVWRGSYDVQRLVKELRLLAEAMAPFRLTVGQPALWGPEPLLNMVGAFTSIEAEGRGGEVGTEYTNVEIIEVPRQRLEQKRARPADSDTERRLHIGGHSLYGLALEAYKRKSAWRTIRDANGIKGVEPDDADALASWAKRHHRTTLRVPARSS